MSFWRIFDSNYFCGAQQWTSNGRSRTRLGNPIRRTCNIISRTSSYIHRSLFLHYYHHHRSRHFEEGTAASKGMVMVVVGEWSEKRRAGKLIRFKIMIMKTSRHDGCHRTHYGHTTDVSGDNTPSPPNLRGYSKTISPQVNTHNSRGEDF